MIEYTETFGVSVQSLLDHMIAYVVLLKNPIQEGATIDRVEIIEILQAFKLS